MKQDNIFRKKVLSLSFRERRDDRGDTLRGFSARLGKY